MATDTSECSRHVFSSFFFLRIKMTGRGGGKRRHCEDKTGEEKKKVMNLQQGHIVMQ